MVKRPYDWKDGAELGEHSKRKHKILSEYFFKYLKVKCSHPQQSNFRIAIVDGFSGGGRYNCGSLGSPLIFIKELMNAHKAINIQRRTQGGKPITFDCFLVFNDTERDAIECLKENVVPFTIRIKEENPDLHIYTEYLVGKFEDHYPKIKEKINLRNYSNVIFNLDQCGYTHVSKETIIDIMNSFHSIEIFLTFMIGSFLQYAPKSDITKLGKYLEQAGIRYADLDATEDIRTKKEWLGVAEKWIFDSFKNCANFFTPFSINHKDGYEYWLMHFSKNYRARQVFNAVLHENSLLQAHYGRSGLNMLSYNLEDGGMLYLFDKEARESSKEQLYYDIPKYLTKVGLAVPVEEFYVNIFNNTPAHTDDIHEAIIENKDVEVVTKEGGLRKKPNTIRANDIIRLADQKSFVFFR